MRTNLNFLHAKHYHTLGLNVGCICNHLTEFNFYEKNILKTPCHEWKHLTRSRQTLEELESYPWDDSTGVAIITGFNNLHVIDIDGCSNISFINDILKILKLPPDYEWVICSGSNNGYHIYFISDILSEISNDTKVSTYPPNIWNEVLFEKLEILWQIPVVTMPSLHITTNKYEFVNCRIPKHLPLEIDIIRFKLIKGLFLNRSKVLVDDDYSAIGKRLVQPSDIDVIDLNTIKNTLFLIFDTKTDGLSDDSNPLKRVFPNSVQLSWFVMDTDGIIYKKETRIINCNYNKNPETFNLDTNIFSLLASPPKEVYKDIINDIKFCDYIVAHNLAFNLDLLTDGLAKNNIYFDFSKIKKICTQKVGISVFNINNKHLNLSELYNLLFNHEVIQTHNSESDALLVLKCSRELLKRKKLTFTM